MKIVVIGGSGLIGTKLVKILRDGGHDVLAASRSTGVDTQTGEGLAGALAGAPVVVDVANAPSWEDDAVLKFFETAGRNIHAAETVAGVKHHVALSVVGTDRLLASGYFRAKMAQENLIKESQIPYTIVRATQFFEFVGGIADGGTQGNTVWLSNALMQPIYSNDVAAILADVAVAPPLNTTIDIAGPDPIRKDELVRQYFAAKRDARQVTTDPAAGYFGTPVNDDSLVPTRPNPRLGPTHFSDWLRTNSWGGHSQRGPRATILVGPMRRSRRETLAGRMFSRTVDMLLRRGESFSSATRRQWFSSFATHVKTHFLLQNSGMAGAWFC